MARLANATAPLRARGGRVRLAALTTMAARLPSVLGYAGYFELDPDSQQWPNEQ
jgi:hypothetical protein